MRPSRSMRPRTLTLEQPDGVSGVTLTWDPKTQRVTVGGWQNVVTELQVAEMDLFTFLSGLGVNSYILRRAATKIHLKERKEWTDLRLEKFRRMRVRANLQPPLWLLRKGYRPFGWHLVGDSTGTTETVKCDVSELETPWYVDTKILTFTDPKIEYQLQPFSHKMLTRIHTAIGAYIKHLGIWAVYAPQPSAAAVKEHPDPEVVAEVKRLVELKRQLRYAKRK